jgi:hypothetical protein
VPVRDVLIHDRENDLVVGTHGRGIFVTDITPLSELTEELLAGDVHMFAPEAKGLRVESGWGNYRLFGHRHVTTPNEPNGIVIDLYRRDATADNVTLRITDKLGTLVRTIEPQNTAGIQRVFWNLRNEKNTVVEPGEYTITLQGGSARQTRTAVVKPPLVLPRR